MLCWASYLLKHPTNVRERKEVIMLFLVYGKLNLETGMQWTWSSSESLEEYFVFFMDIYKEHVYL